MKEEELVKKYIEAFCQVFHPPLNSGMDFAQEGVGAVLKLLYASGEAITAGEIAKSLRVSTARVAVILNKMQEKDLIVKVKNPNDQRVTLVQITEHGHEVADYHRKKVYQLAKTVIHTIDEKRLDEFISVAMEIKQIIQKENEQC